jgi:hypothetical protein
MGLRGNLSGGSSNELFTTGIVVAVPGGQRLIKNHNKDTNYQFLHLLSYFSTIKI